EHQRGFAYADARADRDWHRSVADAAAVDRDAVRGTRVGDGYPSRGHDQGRMSARHVIVVQHDVVGTGAADGGRAGSKRVRSAGARAADHAHFEVSARADAAYGLRTV